MSLVAEEDRSDDGDDPIDGDESDEENTENEDQTVPSADSNHNNNSQPYIHREGSPALHVDPPDDDPHATPSAKSRASAVAFQRGLNLNLAGSTSKSDRRRSRLPAMGGLPPSPRPTGQGQGQAGSPLSTPTFGGSQSQSQQGGQQYQHQPPR